MDVQGICDFVFETIIGQYKAARQHRRCTNDVLFARDMKQIRTLSLLAVGFGGKMLAAIFRCLCFDYRHYSAVLPDLLIVRATYISPEGRDCFTGDFVDLKKWVGEGFECEVGKSGMLADMDDDCLGWRASEEHGVSSQAMKGSTSRSTTSRIMAVYLGKYN